MKYFFSIVNNEEFILLKYKLRYLFLFLFVFNPIIGFFRPSDKEYFGSQLNSFN